MWVYKVWEFIYIYSLVTQLVKNQPVMGADLGSIPRLGRSPGGGHGNPLQYSCLENPHGQRSLEGCSPWGHTESDMPERLSTAQRLCVCVCVCVCVESCFKTLQSILRE